MSVSQVSVQRALRQQLALLEKNFRANVRNYEQHVVYDEHRFFVVCIADVNDSAETPWETRVISIYAPRMAPFERRFDPQPGQPGYVGARAVFDACVTKGVNYVVTLLYGNVAEAVAAAVREFGPRFTGRPYLKDIAVAALAVPPELRDDHALPQPRLRTFHFEAVPKGELQPPPPVEDPDDPLIEHHIRNQTVATYQWGGLRIYVWIAPCKWRGEAIFRYYLTDADGEHFYTFPCNQWPNKPTMQAVERILREQGWTLE